MHKKRWYGLILGVLLLIPLRIAFAFPDLDDERWDPGMTLAREAGLGQELALSAAVGGVTMTLDWVYLDSERFGFEYHLTGIPFDEKLQYLDSSMSITDQAGKVLNVMSGDGLNEWADPAEGVTRGVWSGELFLPAEGSFENIVQNAQQPLTLRITLFDSFDEIGVRQDRFSSLLKKPD